MTVLKFSGHQPYEQRITDRNVIGDYQDDITLECGHIIARIGYNMPGVGEVIVCAKCLHQWIEKQKVSGKRGVH